MSDIMPIVVAHDGRRSGKSERWLEITLTPEGWALYGEAVCMPGATCEVHGVSAPVVEVWPERHTFRVEFADGAPA